MVPSKSLMEKGLNDAREWGIMQLIEFRSLFGSRRLIFKGNHRAARSSFVGPSSPDSEGRAALRTAVPKFVCLWVLGTAGLKHHLTIKKLQDGRSSKQARNRWDKAISRHGHVVEQHKYRDCRPQT